MYLKTGYLLDVEDNKILCMHAVVYKVKYLHDIIYNIFYMNQPIDNMLSIYIKKNKMSACVSQESYFDQNISLGSNLEYIIDLAISL